MSIFSSYLLLWRRHNQTYLYSHHNEEFSLTTDSLWCCSNLRPANCNYSLILELSEWCKTNFQKQFARLHLTLNPRNCLPEKLTVLLSSTSEVILSNIDVGVAGIWECLATSSRGNNSQQMEIVVLEMSTTYCPVDRVTNNKGDFRWVSNHPPLTAAPSMGVHLSRC